jgi:hypothetical protein
MKDDIHKIKHLLHDCILAQVIATFAFELQPIHKAYMYPITKGTH